MKTGEVKAREAQAEVVPIELEQNNQAEFVGATLESEVSVKEKIVSNLQVKERFLRLKKSLRKKSVSIL